MKLLLNSFLLICFVFVGTAQEKDGITILGKESFAEAIKENNVQLLDVRTPKEYAEGHITDAKLLNYFEKDAFRKYASKLDKEKPVYLYCRSGNRSQKASKILADMGFTKIYDLKGGYMNWSK